jgi:hypothetical protein
VTSVCNLENTHSNLSLEKFDRDLLDDVCKAIVCFTYILNTCPLVFIQAIHTLKLTDPIVFDFDYSIATTLTE